MTPRCLVALAMFLALGCELERVEPATPGSPSAEGAALAGELAELSVRIQEHALAVQAASDPEALSGAGEPPDLERIQVELSQLRARRDELAGRLEAMEQLAASPAQ